MLMGQPFKTFSTDLVYLFQKGDLICEVNGTAFQNILHRDAVEFLLNCDTKLAISYQVKKKIFLNFLNFDSVYIGLIMRYLTSSVS